MPSARPEEDIAEIEDVIGIDGHSAPLVSAKEGIGIKEVLEKVVSYFPAPSGDENKPLKALIFDSFYDNYKGAVCLVRIFDGKIKAGYQNTAYEYRQGIRYGGGRVF